MTDTPVALLVSAWIEIKLLTLNRQCPYVALLVSAWIEIQRMEELGYGKKVALLVSAWIEIGLGSHRHDRHAESHSS